MCDLLFYRENKEKDDKNILAIYRNIFTNTIIVNNTIDIVNYLKNITNITIVLSNNYMTYAIKDLQNFIEKVSAINNYDLILLAPYRLLCAQLLKTSIIEYPFYNVSGFNFEQVKFRTELYYPNIKNKINSRRNLKTLTLLPNLFHNDMQKITQLTDFNNNDLCINYTIKKEKEKAYILFIIFFCIIILLVIWYFTNYFKFSFSS